MNLKGRIALVTGGGRGIGAGIAETLAGAGATVVVTGRNEERLAAVARAIGGVAVGMDLTDRAATDTALQQIAAEVGRVEILVNNAGMSDAAPIDRTTDESWDQIMELNLTAPLRLCRTLIPAMVEAGWGRVINLASNAGLSGYSYTHAYCASKHGLVGLTRSMAHELGTTGVTVNAVCPGWVNTNMYTEAIDRIVRTTGRTAQQAEKMLTSMSPQRRAVEVAEVSHAVLMLCHDNARGMHGQTLVVDGGQVMK